MKKILLILLCLPMIGFGQDSESAGERMQRWTDNASIYEVLELQLRVAEGKVIEYQNKLDSAKNNLISISDIQEKNYNKYIKFEGAQAQILFDLVHSRRDVMSIERGNMFQSLLRSCCILIPSIFSKSQGSYYQYQKFDKFCVRFVPSYGLEFTNNFALEILQMIYFDQYKMYNKKIFNDNQLDHIYGGGIFDLSCRDNHHRSYQKYSWDSGPFALFNIVKYIRYLLYLLVLLIAIRYFRKRQSIKKKSL
jgi:hypothetical protein